MSLIIRQKNALIFTLPFELFGKIFSYLKYDVVSGLRLVCRFFNQACQEHLNQGFLRAERFHNRCSYLVKIQLPRRESERRNHPLARHADVLTAVETRLSLLSMTYKKFMDQKQCCFIPGKVLDETISVIREVFRYIDKEPNSHKELCSPQNLRPHEVLQELRDISSMAMEHFDEHISPRLRALQQQHCYQEMTRANILYESRDIIQDFMVIWPENNKKILPSTNNFAQAPPPALVRMSKQLQSINSQLTAHKKELTYLRNMNQRIAQKFFTQNKVVQEQSRRLDEMNRRFVEYDNRILELNGKIRNDATTSTSSGQKHRINSSPTRLSSPTAAMTNMNCVLTRRRSQLEAADSKSSQTLPIPMSSRRSTHSNSCGRQSESSLETSIDSLLHQSLSDSSFVTDHSSAICAELASSNVNAGKVFFKFPGVQTRAMRRKRDDEIVAPAATTIASSAVVSTSARLGKKRDHFAMSDPIVLSSKKSSYESDSSADDASLESQAPALNRAKIKYLSKRKRLI